MTRTCPKCSSIGNVFHCPETRCPMKEPICDTCNDTGWKDQRQRSLDPIPCPDCAEREAESRPASREEWEAHLTHIESAIASCQAQIAAIRNLEYAFEAEFSKVCKAGYGP